LSRPSEPAEEPLGAVSRPTPTRTRALPDSVEATLNLLATGHYVADRSLATALFLSLRLGRPLFLEGEAGVGKTEVAKVLAQALDRRLIRLQCYEGLDIASAVYEWNYPRQMLEIRLAEATGGDARVDRDVLVADIFSPDFLIKRPLLEALEPHAGEPPVLLIDELDRTDEAFEAFLLEVLSDFQVTIPELGTVRAAHPPLVIVTSNRTREIHDALKRRCFYHWIDYPDAERERAILRVRVPEATESLTRQVVAFVQRLRATDLFKLPGVAESIDWTRALLALDRVELDPGVVDDTLGVLLKYQDDIERVSGALAAQTLSEIQREPQGEPAP
jgi:MoxR-like ATPase